jgi:hypothetical protein
MSQKPEVRKVIPEFVLYSILVAAFCLGTVWSLGRPLQALFHQHRLEYACAALLLMMVQGLALERLAHVICSPFRRGRKATR